LSRHILTTLEKALKSRIDEWNGVTLKLNHVVLPVVRFSVPPRHVSLRNNQNAGPVFSVIVLEDQDKLGRFFDLGSRWSMEWRGRRVLSSVVISSALIVVAKNQVKFFFAQDNDSTQFFCHENQLALRLLSRQRKNVLHFDVIIRV